MTVNNYDKISKKIQEAVKSIAEKTMHDAASEIKSKLAANDDTGVDTAFLVMVHGSGMVISH